MKKKLLTTLLAAVLCTPQVAFAARDGEGMQYTSASEGFYGSIRTVFNSGSSDKDTKDAGASIGADGSRLGVQGTLDLGSGLTGLYRYEWEIFGDNGASPQGKTRLSYVGLRGGWGEVQAGSLWANDYNWITAGTDIATTGSGNFAPVFRAKNNFQYTSPDIGNGAQLSFRLGMNGGSEKNGSKVASEQSAARIGTCEFTTAIPVAATVTVDSQLGNTNCVAADYDLSSVFSNAGDFDAAPQLGALETSATPDASSESLDEWAIAAKYSSHGFTGGVSYQVQPDRAVNAPLFGVIAAVDTPLANGDVVIADDGNLVRTSGTRVTVGAYTTSEQGMETIGKEDNTFWAVRFGYGQNNWSINGWYGEHNTSETFAPSRSASGGIQGTVGAAGVPVVDATALANGQGMTVINSSPGIIGASPQDTEIFSIAGNIDMGKIALVAIYETRDNQWAETDNVFLLNADYNFTSQSKAYIAYIANDFDSDTDKDDEVRIGLRMDF